MKFETDNLETLGDMKPGCPPLSNDDTDQLLNRYSVVFVSRHNGSSDLLWGSDRVRPRKSDRVRLRNRSVKVQSGAILRAIIKLG